MEEAAGRRGGEDGGRRLIDNPPAGATSDIETSTSCIPAFVAADAACSSWNVAYAVSLSG